MHSSRPAKRERMISLVENLTLRTWCISVLPRLTWKRLKAESVEHCYIIDGSRLALWVARLTAGVAARVLVEKLAFRLVEVRDEQGLLIRLRITYQDLAEVQRDIMRETAFRDFLNSNNSEDRLLAYLARSVSTTGFSRRQTLWRALFLIQICLWKAKSEQRGGDPGGLLFLERRPWFKAIERYASRYGVEIIGVRPAIDVGVLLQRLLKPRGIATARTLRHRFYRVWAQLFKDRKRNALGGGSWPHIVRHDIGPRVAVEYSGHFNLNKPECHSDLFFWQQSSLSGKDILVTFGLPQDPVDQRKWEGLTHNGIATVALHPQATKISSVPLFTQRLSRSKATIEKGRMGDFTWTPERKWLDEQIENYRVLRDYWTQLFSSQGIKLYVTWYRYDARHCAIADALQSLGGVTAIYQRALEVLPSPECAVATDIMFGYAPQDAEVERHCGSKIPYHVSVGYFGDHRFPLLRDMAQEVRSALRRNGAQYIVAFFDENSADDARWHTGHEFQRENYAFLLEKVFSEPLLGVVFKPKYPPTLRKRLGPVSELLDRAIATGRCYVYEAGPLHGSYPPAAAALAADVAIHGHLCAATAGLEAALAGVPTLLLDREGWHVSPLYRLGVGTVVFTSWEELWDAVMGHRKSTGGIPKFGDWSDLLDELDPFRDGRAAERMGTYLKWLIDGFKAGLDRDTVMADAAERYCAAWGRDKITEVNYPGKMERLVPKQAVPLQGGLGRADRGALAARDS